VSALTDRITEVLREHELGYNVNDEGEGGFHCVSVDCDWYGHDLDFPAHVAERVEAELASELGCCEQCGGGCNRGRSEVEL
jgi:hypothetical protein